MLELWSLSTTLQWIAAPTCIYGKPLFGLIELFKTGSMRMGVSGREPKTGVSVIKKYIIGT